MCDCGVVASESFEEEHDSAGDVVVADAEFTSCVVVEVFWAEVWRADDERVAFVVGDLCVEVAGDRAEEVWFVWVGDVVLEGVEGLDVWEEFFVVVLVELEGVAPLFEVAHADDASCGCARVADGGEDE